MLPQFLGKANNVHNTVSTLSYGENRYFGQDGMWTVHAEDHAIMNLKPLPRNRRKLERVNILVIRTSKTGYYGNSKPCMHCIAVMQFKLPQKGYYLNRIYYTDGDGGIQSVRLNDLIHDKNPHVSIYYKTNGTVFKK